MDSRFLLKFESHFDKIAPVYSIRITKSIFFLYGVGACNVDIFALTARRSPFILDREIIKYIYRKVYMVIFQYIHFL